MKKISCFIAIILLLTLAIPFAASAANGLAFEVSETTVCSSTDTVTVTVDISGNNGSGISGASLTIVYDHEVLALTDVKAGSLISDSTKYIVTAPNNDRVSVVGIADIKGDGEFLILTFDVLKDGTSEVSITVNSLSDSNYRPVSATVNAGSVRVGHTAGDAVVENRVEPDLVNNKVGSYDSVTYCTVCGAEISRETVTIPALGFTLESAGSTVCSPTDTVTVIVNISGNGKPGISMANLAIIYDHEFLSLTDIKAGALIEDTRMFTTTPNVQADKVSVVGARGEVTSDGQFLILTFAVLKEGTSEVSVGVNSLYDGNFSAVSPIIKSGTVKVGHTVGETVVENEVAAGCTTAGSYDNVT